MVQKHCSLFCFSEIFAQTISLTDIYLHIAAEVLVLSTAYMGFFIQNRSGPSRVSHFFYLTLSADIFYFFFYILFCVKSISIFYFLPLRCRASHKQLYHCAMTDPYQNILIVSFSDFELPGDGSVFLS